VADFDLGTQQNMESFQKCSALCIGTKNETSFDPCLRYNRSPSGFAEIVSDDFPIRKKY